jgi:hypothetical protein
MKKMFIWGLFALCFFAGQGISLHAQEKAVSFEMKLSKEKLGLNERLKVEFTMNKDGDNFQPPEFADFNVVMGPSQTVSNSWSNGKRSFYKTYWYILNPRKKGSLRIEQATIEIEGQTYKTVPKTVVVTAAVSNPNAPKTANDIAGENLHLVAEVSKTNPYLNEAVSVVYKLYISRDISVNNYRPLDNPQYNNFWSQDIPVTRYKSEPTTYKGKPYLSVVLKRVVLYPQKSGKLEIEPLALEIYVDVPTSRRSFFGQRIYTQATQRVSAGKRVLNVKPLPEQGKPEDFSGAVGDFTFSVTASKTRLNASESLQAKVSVEGDGNLKLFQLPKLTLPSALEVYEPEFNEDVRTNLSGMKGSVSESYTVVPSFRGQYPIPSVSFSYFNPKTRSYQTVNSDEITLQVLEGPEDNSTSTNTGVVNRNTVSVPSGEQFHFIKLKSDLIPVANQFFLGSSRFYWWLLLPLALVPLSLLVRQLLAQKDQDQEKIQLRQTNRLARKYLTNAKKALGNKEAFYIALERALHNYLKAKLRIETFEFSKEKIQSLLEEKQAKEQSIEQLIQLLTNCEMARYSPFSTGQMQDDYQLASKVIAQLDKELPK